MNFKYIGWGFKSLERPDGGIFFQSGNFHDSIKQAIEAGREVFTFNNQKDLAQFVLNN